MVPRRHKNLSDHDPGFNWRKYLKFSAWIAWKSLQVFVRKHLSHVLAIGLAVLVLFREAPELLPLGLKPTWWLIAFGTVATAVAALWEIYGNKLSTSPQEVRFLATMRLMLFELEKFSHGIRNELNLEQRLEQFISDFLDFTTATLCGHKRVDGCLMIEVPEKKVLTIYKSSRDAKYPAPNKWEIPIPTDASVKTGPAGISYNHLKIVYVPIKSWGWGCPFELKQRDNGKEVYEPLGPYHGWVDAPSPELEKFTSILCVPVAVHTQASEMRAMGVLNYSTDSFDPFVDRDFLMGECFGSILAQVLEITRIEALRRDQSSQPPPPVNE
jgi:hypothetical protein